MVLYMGGGLFFAREKFRDSNERSPKHFGMFAWSVINMAGAEEGQLRWTDALAPFLNIFLDHG